MNSIDFVDALLEEINALRDSDMHSIPFEEAQTVFPDVIIKHWLDFAVYYERAAVSFIGGWLKNIKDEELLHHYTHQIEDECNHFRWLKKHQAHYGGDFNAFTPPKEWQFLMEDYYPNLENIIEQLAAHNIAAETGALGFLEYGLERFPTPVRETALKVLKDETYHVQFGAKFLRKYCTTAKLQDLARRSALESMEHMHRAREVFVQI